MADVVAAPSPYGEGFDRLSPSVLYRVPPQTTKPSGQSISKEPGLIFLAAWMEAIPKHIAAYATRYRRIFPTSRILVVTTTLRHFLFTSDAQRLRDLEPALDILIHDESKILLHAFSNGGAMTAWLVSRTIHQRTGKPLRLSKACFDSAPGVQTYSISLTTLSAILPNNLFMRMVGMPALRVLFAVWFGYIYISGTEKILDSVRKGLNDLELFPSSVTRLYIYSTADKIVHWQDVESHAKDAERIGYKVQMCKYVNSSHVAHLTQDQKKYLSAVVGLWDSSYLNNPGTVITAW